MKLKQIVIQVPDGFMSCKLDVVLIGKFRENSFPRVEVHSEFPIVDDCQIIPWIVLPDELRKDETV